MVISPKIIRPHITRMITAEVTLHDDGVEGIGGSPALVVGFMGSGKSTLLAQLSQQMCHLKDQTREEFFRSGCHGTVYPETVLWRGQQFDHWNALLPHNWERSFPGWRGIKPVRVHVNCDDNLKFTQKNEKTKQFQELEGIYNVLKYYRNSEDLIKNVLPGGINIVYEPQEFMPGEKLISDLNARKMVKNDDNPERKAGKYLTVEPHIFWFELTAYLLEHKAPDEFYTLVLDESHELFPYGATGDHWHLISYFVDSIIHTRKNNVSLLCAIHDVNLMDFRVRDRMKYFYWLPGSVPIKRVSRVYPDVVSKLELGEVIMELKRKDFSGDRFQRIKDQPPVVRVEVLD